MSSWHLVPVCLWSGCEAPTVRGVELFVCLFLFFFKVMERKTRPCPGWFAEPRRRSGKTLA